MRWFESLGSIAMDKIVLPEKPANVEVSKTIPLSAGFQV